MQLHEEICQSHLPVKKNKELNIFVINEIYIKNKLLSDIF